MIVPNLTPDHRRKHAVLFRIVLTAVASLKLVSPTLGADPPWRSPNNFRLLLNVDGRGVSRSNSPATVDLDFAKALADQGISGTFDEHTIEVTAYDALGVPKVIDASRDGYERYLLPWRLEKYYAVDRATLSFVVPDATCTTFAVYFDTVRSGLGRPRRYPGLVGDGDFFRQDYQRREIGADRFDTFCDLDGDGDLDLFTGGVEPFVYCYENMGENRLEYRGRLTWGGKLLTLPKNDRNNRSWVIPHFHDWDRDGDQDFFPSFMDGPYARKIAFFENTTPPGGQLTFVDRGVMRTVSGVPLAGTEKAGVWFPSIAFVLDFDGDRDGRRDLIACEFEHSIRFYRDEGAGRPREEPRFSSPDGLTIVKPYCIMMISGADSVDWNRDGDPDILTGQGHGGSGIRFYEHDYIEDCINDTHPIVSVEGLQQAPPDLLDVVRRYADAMIEHGRDVYGPKKSGLLLSALDRDTLEPLELRPESPGGVRREDRAGLPWRRLTGANPQLDQNLLRVLYTLSEITGEPRYRRVADHEIQWFFQNAQSPVTGLLCWGEHMSWDVILDQPISGLTELTHEFARPWVLWDRSFQLAPEASKRFALGLWNHQIANQKTGAFDRHAPYMRHGPREGKDFARHAGFYIDTWAHAYKHTKDETFLRAIETVLARYERKRTGRDGTMPATLGPLAVATAADMVPEPLASRLHRFAEVEDRLILESVRERHRRPDGTLAFKPKWQAGYSSGVTAARAMFALARYQQVEKKEYRDLVIAVADAYIDALPDEDVDVWPLTFGQAISLELAAFRITARRTYHARGISLGKIAVEKLFGDLPLPRASLKTEHYESTTGAGTLVMALAEFRLSTLHISAVRIPPNTIDR